MKDFKCCSKCDEIKLLEQFSKQKKGGDSNGLHYYCKACVSKIDKLRYKKNRLKYLQQSREYREENKDTVRQSRRKWWKERSGDLQFKLRHNLRSSIQYAYKSKGMRKNKKTSDILGCAYDYFVEYTESQLEPWMNESNYGKCVPGQPNIGWDIDHIIPLASAKTEEDLIKLCHYTNLKPVCSYYNRYLKRDRLQN